jgi:hypothetical protein
MKFDAKPDIPYIRKLLRDLYHAQGCASVGKLWDWDHIDTDFMTAGAGSGSEGGPPILSNPMRPTTGAAVNGGEMHGDDGEMGTHEGDMHDEEFGVRQTGKERPASSGALPSASGKQPVQQQQQLLSSSWGFSRQQQPMPNELPASRDPRGMPAEYGMGTGIADPSQKRPHTAHGGRVPGQPTASAQDLRKPVTGAGPIEQEEDGDAHVVAGARAMMRYRRTRATDGSEGSGAPSQQQQHPGSGRGTWTGDSSGPQNAAAMSRAHYLGQQQAQPSATRTASAGAVGTSSSGAIGAGAQAQVAKQTQQQYIVQRDKVITLALVVFVFA